VQNLPSPANKVPKKNLLDLKADLYAICRTVEIMKNRFEAGLLTEDFYVRRMKTFLNEITQIQQELLQYGKKIEEIIQEIPEFMPIAQYIREIVSIGDRQFDHNANSWTINPYQIATAAANVTSKFITLLDYLHLASEVDCCLFNELYTDLERSLTEINSFKFFSMEMDNLKPKIMGFLQDPTISSPNIQNQTAIKSVEDTIYRIYSRFKQYLQSTGS
jgi:hypothetical protein